MSTAAHVIALGNEKGGSGKSTAAMHIFATLARYGFTVGAIDLDTRQKSFLEYLSNRKRTKNDKGYRNRDIPLPIVRSIDVSEDDSRASAEERDISTLQNAMAELQERCDFIILDCPGTDSLLGRLGHATADTVITPLNDSYVDLDLIAKYNPHDDRVFSPSIYSEMMAACRQLRRDNGLPDPDWIVMRNRYGPADDGHGSIRRQLQTASSKLGFRLIDGLADRRIYRTLFPLGLTVLDIEEIEGQERLMSGYREARAEVQSMVEAVGVLGGVTKAAAE